MLALATLAPRPAQAAEPQRSETAPLEGPALASELDAQLEELDAQLASSPLQLPTPSFVALAPAPARFYAPPIYAKRSRDREFDTSLGERDPRKRKAPRTHRFRLAVHAQWIRLTRTLNPFTGETERFHLAPMMLDFAYQAHFLKYVMVRIAVAAGGNVANTRASMPVVVYPQAYVGFQSKILGVAFGYGYDWTIPPRFGVAGLGAYQIEQPTIVRNHVVMGEASVTTRVDRVALTFSLAIGGVKSNLTHFETQNTRWRPYFGFQAGAFFDGTIRREKKARKKAEAQGL